jgi:hypothetical protein
MWRLPSNGRTIAAYRGALVPGYLHTIRIEHLRPIPGEARKPYRADATKTHHLWILYRSLRDNRVEILISLQFSLAGFVDSDCPTLDLWQLPDRAAAKIGKFLALRVAPGFARDLKDPKLLRRIPDRRIEEDYAPLREDAWAEAVSKIYLELKNNPNEWNF